MSQQAGSADTNSGTGPSKKQRDELEIPGPGHEVCSLPVQTLGELFHLLVRKAGRRPSRARAAVLGWRDAFAVMETSAAVMISATDLASDHGLTIWDSVVLAAAADAQCRLLLSQDLQAGLTWRGVTVANPFAATLDPILAALLRVGK